MGLELSIAEIVRQCRGEMGQDTEQAEVTAWASLEGIRQTGIWGQDVFLEHRAHFSGKSVPEQSTGKLGHSQVKRRGLC